MTNLFIDTSFRLSEEDRLTNALMALFEHSDQRVLQEFLTLCGEAKRELSSDSPPQFKLQPTFDSSRPDARITLPELDIVIETKRDATLSRNQFQRHWDHIQAHATQPTLLLAITGSHAIPSIVTEFSIGSSDNRCDARHISWSDWLGAIVDLQDDFATETSTGLLLRQFEEYLRSLGYWYFDGPPVDRITDLGVTLRKYWGPHRERTQPYVQERLTSLMHRLETKVTDRDNWSFHFWGQGGLFSKGNCGIARVDCVLTELGSNTRYRVSLNMRSSGELSLSYYMTMWHIEEHFEHIGRALLDRRENLQEFAPFDSFGFWSDRRCFHCSKIADIEPLYAFLNGDDVNADELATDISDFFMAIDGELKSVSEIAEAKD